MGGWLLLRMIGVLRDCSRDLLTVFGTGRKLMMTARFVYLEGKELVALMD